MRIAQVPGEDSGFVWCHAKQTACPGILDHPQRAIRRDLYDTASAAGITTAHGGLLPLFERTVRYLVTFLHIVGRTNQWSIFPVSSAWFQSGFHVMVKGLLYGTAVWLF
jgi:hypothetical protein